MLYSPEFGSDEYDTDCYKVDPLLSLDTIFGGSLINAAIDSGMGSGRRRMVRQQRRGASRTFKCVGTVQKRRQAAEAHHPGWSSLKQEL